MVRIRPSRSQDAAAFTGPGLEALRPVFVSFAECYGSDLFNRWWPDWEETQAERIRLILTDGDVDTRVAEVDGEVAGIIAVTMDEPNGLGDVGLVVVAPSKQRSGVGAALIADALDRFRDAGLAYATAYTRDHPGHLPVRRALERAGFDAMGIQPHTLFTEISANEKIDLPDIVRFGTPDDVAACVRFGIEAFRPVFASFEDLYGADLFHRLRPDWEKEQMAYIESACTDKETLVSMRNGQVSGFVVIETDVFDGIGAIELLAVDPSHENLGLGTLLNHKALNRLGEAGMVYAIVSTGNDPSHAPARRSYERAGFRPLPVQWNLMVKKLSPTMSETITVRDHNQPCEHGSLWSHWVNAANAKWWQEPECLGGRMMTLQKTSDGMWQEIEEVEPPS